VRKRPRPLRGAPPPKKAPPKGPAAGPGAPPPAPTVAGGSPPAGSGTAPSGAPSPAKAEPRILIADVRFANFKILAEDRTPPRPVALHLDQINLDMHNVDNRVETTSHGKVSFRWEEGGTGMMSGDLALLKLQASLEVKFDGLDIAPLDPYAAPTFDMRVSSGKLSVDGKVRASLLDPAHPAFAYQGNLLLQDLLAVDGVKRGEFLKCKRMEIAPI